MTRAFLGLGSNLGDRIAYLRDAVEELEATGELHATSSVFETEPVGGPEQGAYLNLVIELDTASTARDLLALCRRLETSAERVREERWGPRTLDVDLLWVDGITVTEADLVVPHPRMWERRFVLAPLRELAPDLVSEDAVTAADGEVDWRGSLDLTSD